MDHMAEVAAQVRRTQSPADKSSDGDPARCDAGIRRAFDFLGKRWTGVILGTLSDGPVGFADLRRQVGSITDSVLSDRLSELSGIGLVDRTVSGTRPPGVTYQLSAQGQELLPILDQLGVWANQHLPVAGC